MIGKGCPGGEEEEKGTQENCSAAEPTVSDSMVMGLVSRLSLDSHLIWPIFSPTQGPSWYGGVCISQPRWIPVQRILGGWQGMLWASLPSAPPEYFRLVLTISTVFHIGTSYCQTTLPSCHHRAWPRWAGLVDGSLRRLWCRLTQKSLFFL